MPRRTAPPSPWSLVGAPLPDRLAVAQDTASTTEILTVVAPSLLEARNPELTPLIVAVLQHARCPGPVAGRYVGHPEVGVRRAILAVPGLAGTTLQALARDPEADVRERAQTLLDDLSGD